MPDKVDDRQCKEGNDIDQNELPRSPCKGWKRHRDGTGTRHNGCSLFQHMGCQGGFYCPAPELVPGTGVALVARTGLGKTAMLRWPAGSTERTPKITLSFDMGNL